MLCTNDSTLSDNIIEIDNKTYYILEKIDDYLIDDNKAYFLICKYPIDKIYIIKSSFSTLDMERSISLDRIINFI